MVVEGPDQGLRGRWAASGAMALTGDAGGPPLVAPDDVVARIEALGAAAGVGGSAVGGAASTGAATSGPGVGGVSALGLLAERAAFAGLARRGRTSCGGATRLLPASDGWVAVSLAREDDIDLVPAWFGLGGPPADPWATVAAEVARRPAAEVVDGGRPLGLPVARLGEAAQGADRRAGVVARRVDRGGSATGATPRRVPVVVDLSSLWAGPLCAHLLGRAGMRVVKVESTGRPDGARRGPAAFYDLLHGGHESVALDFASAAGRDDLRRLVAAADVVVEASRPRALAQLGIDAEAAVLAGVRAWVSITGHGRASDGAAFGDDAAVAGGLVAWLADGTPAFVADAVADPLTGLAAAGAVLRALHDTPAGARWFLDVSMSHVAADIAGPPAAAAADPVSAGGGDARSPWATGSDDEAHPPRARPPAARAPSLGAHTASVLADLVPRRTRAAKRSASPDTAAAGASDRHGGARAARPGVVVTQSGGAPTGAAGEADPRTAAGEVRRAGPQEASGGTGASAGAGSAERAGGVDAHRPGGEGSGALGASGSRTAAGDAPATGAPAAYGGTGSGAVEATGAVGGGGAGAGRGGRPW